MEAYWIDLSPKLNRAMIDNLDTISNLRSEVHAPQPRLLLL
jgi:hypothetical protein